MVLCTHICKITLTVYIYIKLSAKGMRPRMKYTSFVSAADINFGARVAIAQMRMEDFVGFICGCIAIFTACVCISNIRISYYHRIYDMLCRSCTFGAFE